MSPSASDRFWINIQNTPLDVGAVAQFLYTPAAGGVDIFVGTTRRWTEDRETLRLEYECYPPMARAEMERLLEAARSRWPVERACMVHRLGVVPVAEASVVVGVATPHRAEAFAATHYLIDALKQQVPIWKREVYTDGATEWVEGDRPPSIRLPGDG
jgi:molybdopterin synthase catalytic subunit